MAVETPVQTLIINRLTQAQYDELKLNDELNDNELYITTDAEETLSKVSQLENDTGYLTESQVDEKLNNSGTSIIYWD